MKRFGVCLCVAAGLAFALAPAADAKGQKKKGPAAHSMTGCLQKGEGNMFTLSNVEGSGPKTVEIVGTAAGVNLAPHVGHKIEITGTAVAAKQAAKAEGAKGKEKKEERGEHHMRVQAVKMIAASCP
jgi:hypothetical protein